MNATKWTVAAAVAALVGSLPTVAAAQERDEGPYLRFPMLAPARAFEMGLSTEYTQGFGLLSSSAIDTGDLGATKVEAFPRGGVNNIADAGVGFTLSLGYRANPTVAIGWSGQYAQFDPGQDLEGRGTARGIVTSVDSTAHTAPFSRLDPWLAVGTGYRMLWSVPEGPNNNVLTHGFELARLKFGVDIRASDSVSMGPYVGADPTYFAWQNAEGPSGTVEIAAKRVSTFLYAGLQGTFTIGGERRAQLIVPTSARR